MHGLLLLVLLFVAARLVRAGDEVADSQKTQPEMAVTYVSPTNGLGS
jgi:hypothetical protein